MREPRHFGGDGDIGHALAVCTGGITPEISFELVAEAVLAQPDGHGSGHPKDAAQPCVAVLRQLGGSAELARLLGGEIEAAELEELAMMVEAAQVACFSKDRQRQDGSDAWQLLETLEVGVVLKVKLSSFFQLMTQLAEADHLAEHDAEHGHRF